MNHCGARIRGAANFSEVDFSAELGSLWYRVTGLDWLEKVIFTSGRGKWRPRRDLNPRSPP